jgi:natural product precursor
MKKIKNLKLNQLVQAELAKNEMNSIKGGSGNCCCGCNYSNQGGSSTADNDAANNAGDLKSPGCSGSSCSQYPGLNLYIIGE